MSLLTLALVALVMSAPAHAEDARGERARRCEQDPRVRLKQVSYEACIGAELFFRETFGGNGRTCGSCHPAGNNYTVDPEYIARLPKSDALFVSEHDPALADLEIPRLLHDHALFVVNPDGFEDPTHKFLVRSSPHLLGMNVSTTPAPPDPEFPGFAVDGTPLPFPQERLGWGGDGAPMRGALRDFADGAIIQHATQSLERKIGVDFTLPSDDERDALAKFMRSIGRMNDLDLQRVQLTDAAADRGKLNFNEGHGRECAFRCHNNAGAIAKVFDSIETDGKLLGIGNLTLDVGTPLVRLPAVDALAIPIDGGFGRLPLDSDADGNDDSFGNGGFNVPPLIEAADTGPFFHTHAAATLEDAIRFYTTLDFGNSLVGNNGFGAARERGAGMSLSESDIAEIARFLRVLNVALNLQMANARLAAAREIVLTYGNRHTTVVRGLIELANAELEDAVQVLRASSCLHEREQGFIRDVRDYARSAGRPGQSSLARSLWLHKAIALNQRAFKNLGVGLDMQMGEGTLLY